jgi:hypothetical protein
MMPDSLLRIAHSDSDATLGNRARSSPGPGVSEGVRPTRSLIARSGRTRNVTAATR